MMRLHWIETTGGPHLLAPVETLSSWRGAEGWHDSVPEDASDYARACRIKGWLGKIQSGDGEAVVLGNEPGVVAWIPEDDTSGVLVRWIGCDSEETIFDLLASRRPNHGFDSVSKLDTESEEFDTGPSGKMTLLDSSDSGYDGMFERYTFVMRPGRYRITASYVDTDLCTLLLMDVKHISR
jgi:hypothetical protein